MKFLIILLSILSFKLQAQNKSDVYQADLSSSIITWTGHAQAGTYSPQGTLRLKSGTLSIKNGKLLAAKIIVDMESLKHEKPDLQNHLKDKDFFDVKKYPEAIFTLKRVKGTIAYGELTVKGISQPVNFPFNLVKSGDALVLKANLSVDRTKFNIKYNSTSFFQDLGNYAIRNEFELTVNCIFLPK
ncbi:YceI family protein [Pedobacter sp.]|uniref:YceI family protein n=1 Tax=Pedobacter sp. TaxID=1411316 RepID=UPI0031D2B24E